MFLQFRQTPKSFPPFGFSEDVGETSPNFSFYRPYHFETLAHTLKFAKISQIFQALHFNYTTYFIFCKPLRVKKYQIFLGLGTLQRFAIKYDGLIRLNPVFISKLLIFPFCTDCSGFPEGLPRRLFRNNQKIFVIFCGFFLVTCYNWYGNFRQL